MQDAELPDDEVLLGVEGRLDVLLELGELAVLDWRGAVVNGRAAAGEVGRIYEDI